MKLHGAGSDQGVASPGAASSSGLGDARIVPLATASLTQVIRSTQNELNCKYVRVQTNNPSQLRYTSNLSTVYFFINAFSLRALGNGNVSLTLCYDGEIADEIAKILEIQLDESSTYFTMDPTTINQILDKLYSSPRLFAGESGAPNISDKEIQRIKDFINKHIPNVIQKSVLANAGIPDFASAKSGPYKNRGALLAPASPDANSGRQPCQNRFLNHVRYIPNVIQKSDVVPTKKVEPLPTYRFQRITFNDRHLAYKANTEGVAPLITRFILERGKQPSMTIDYNPEYFNTLEDLSGLTLGSSGTYKTENTREIDKLIWVICTEKNLFIGQETNLNLSPDEIQQINDFMPSGGNCEAPSLAKTVILNSVARWSEGQPFLSNDGLSDMADGEERRRMGLNARFSHGPRIHPEPVGFSTIVGEEEAQMRSALAQNQEPEKKIKFQPIVSEEEQMQWAILQSVDALTQRASETKSDD